MAGIFISYRRSDSSPWAGRLYDLLVNAWGRDYVFMDVDTFAPGDDFRVSIAAMLRRCDVVLVVIGPRWASAIDERKERRLDDRADIHRAEVESALDSGLLVIPVVVGGASMPKVAELPAPLTDLAYRTAVHLEDRGFRVGFGVLQARLFDYAQERAASQPVVTVPPVAPAEPEPQELPPPPPKHVGRGRRRRAPLVVLLVGASAAGVAALLVAVSGSSTTSSSTTPTTTKSTSTSPSPNLDPSNLLHDASFENGTAWGATFHRDSVQFTTPRVPAAYDGQRVGAVTVSVAEGSIAQDVSVPMHRGDTFVFSAWLRSDEAPIHGRIGFWAGVFTNDLEPPYLRTDLLKEFEATDRWQQVTFALTLAGDHHGVLRAEIYVLTPGRVLFIDDASLTQP